MKSTLKLILSMIIPLVGAQGIAMQNQDDNDTGNDDIIGEGLVYLGHFAQFLLDKANSKNVKPPAVPESLATSN